MPAGTEAESPAAKHLATAAETPTAHDLGVPKLYRYQRFSAAEPTDVDRLRKIVLEGRIYMSRPDSFNDPWDCRPWYNSDVTSDPVVFERSLSKYVAVTRRLMPQLPAAEVQRRADWFRQNPSEFAARIPGISDAMWGAINDRYRVYCLASKPDAELMWAHYGRSHTGICLEFASDSTPLATSFRVRYQSSYPTLDWASDDLNEALSVLLTKSAVWSYEEEFRFIMQTPQYVSDPRVYRCDASGHFQLPQRTLKRIIAGAQAQQSTLDSISALLREVGSGIELVRARMAPDRYSILVPT